MGITASSSARPMAGVFTQRSPDYGEIVGPGALQYVALDERSAGLAGYTPSTTTMRAELHSSRIAFRRR